ncbi:peptidoglycan-binding protein [Streptomyces sp. NPDC004267]|uniref:peptidoglycan-binding domain-containing protein n=1 Tax=Streptomyces sp. NPDC004267 TaxID=3364694 RepID=UPI0036A07C5E
MSGNACPECGAHRPGCACERTQAQAAALAAAEDFDPLRIRPYVSLGAPDDDTALMTPVPPLPPAGPLPPEMPPGAVTELPTQPPAQVRAEAVHPTGGYGTAPASAYADGYGTGYGQGYETGPAVAGYETGPAANPYAPGHAPAPENAYQPEGNYPPEPQGAYESAGAYEPAHTLAYAPDGHGEKGRGRGRAALVAGVVAAAVVGTAVLATVLIGGDDQTEDRADVPTVTTSASLNLAVSEAPTTTPSSSASTSASPTASRTPASASPSPKATRTATTRAPVAPTAPASPTATAPASGTAPTETGAPDAETLRQGDSGPAVEDLQWRLNQIGLYSGSMDGRYGKRVRHGVEVFQSYMDITEDPSGVYGPTTRRELERMTSSQGNDQ